MAAAAAEAAAASQTLAPLRLPPVKLPKSLEAVDAASTVARTFIANSFRHTHSLPPLLSFTLSPSFSDGVRRAPSAGATEKSDSKAKVANGSKCWHEHGRLARTDGIPPASKLTAIKLSAKIRFVLRRGADGYGCSCCETTPFLEMFSSTDRKWWKGSCGSGRLTRRRNSNIWRSNASNIFFVHHTAWNSKLERLSMENIVNLD